MMDFPLKESNDINRPRKYLSNPVELNSSCFQLQDIAGKFKESAPKQPFKLLTFHQYKTSLSIGSESCSDKSEDIYSTSCPSKMYCPSCRKYVGTLVKHFFTPYLSFWDRICCKKMPRETKVTIMHSCRYCSLVLAKFISVD